MSKKSISLIFLYILIMHIFSISASAWQIEDQDSNDKNLSSQDSVLPKKLDEFVGANPIESKKYSMTKSPTTAILLSFVLPGLGQYYVESYWKIPIFVGAAGVLTYLIIDNHKLFKQKDALMPSDKNSPVYNRYLSEREGYRDIRDQSYFYLAGVYILAAVDAYVGAHLYDFDVSDDLSLNLNFSKSAIPSFGVTFNW